MPTFQEQVGSQVYNPYTAPSPTSNFDTAQQPKAQGPFPGGVAGNPYGFSQAPERQGDFLLFGGPRDMAKSSATRSLAILGIQKQMEQEATPQGLQQSLSSYAQKNPYLASLQQNYSTGIDSQSMIAQQENVGKLRELMEGAYVLGGGIYGSALAAWAQAKEQKKAKDLAKTQRLQAILSGVGKGLTGGNDYGSTDTTVGLVGGLEQ